MRTALNWVASWSTTWSDFSITEPSDHVTRILSCKRCWCCSPNRRLRVANFSFCAPPVASNYPIPELNATYVFFIANTLKSIAGRCWKTWKCSPLSPPSYIYPTSRRRPKWNEFWRRSTSFLGPKLLKSFPKYPKEGNGNFDSNDCSLKIGSMRVYWFSFFAFI